ncbi:hypothetical protein J1614_007227 [Plenodomus biglobosus]|nr:hypothetical protein J1614_007227 [Plenodomus biglobosus]
MLRHVSQSCHPQLLCKRANRRRDPGFTTVLASTGCSRALVQHSNGGIANLANAARGNVIGIRLEFSNVDTSSGSRSRIGSSFWPTSSLARWHSLLLQQPQTLAAPHATGPFIKQSDGCG